MRHVRRSETATFLRCRKQWSYAWVQNLEPKRPDNKLFFGNLAHKFLEVYYRDNMNFDSAMKAMMEYYLGTDTSGMEQTELSELWTLVAGVMENYVKQWEKADEGITVLATELRFAIPLDDETVYEGTIDMVYLDKDGRLFFKDYKNVASIERYVDMAEMDTQISCYWWALEQLARGNGAVWNTELERWKDISVIPLGTQLKEPSGFFYDLILKDVPNVPEQLKKGGLSKAKAQKTTYAAYWQAMIDNGLVSFENEFDMSEYDKSYDEILNHLMAQETEYGNRFFRRIPVVRNENECQAAMQEFMAVAKDMSDVRYGFDYGVFEASSKTYRNINADCSWCNYRALCVAELDGSHADMIKNLAYKQKELKPNDHSIGEI